MRNNRPKLAAVAVVGLVAAGGSAFTAANTTTPSTSVGQAAEVTTGYAVDNVEYTLGLLAGATGDDIATVTFDLEADAGANVADKARVRLVSTGNYFECTTGTAAGQTVSFSCAITGTDASAVNTLDIVAVSDHS